MMRALACLLASLLALPAAAQFDFSRALEYGKKAVDTGKKLSEATKEFSTEDEIELGNGIAAQFLGGAPLDRDANLQRYVNRVGKWVALHSDRPDLPWTFGVVEGDTINAFAMPGGTVIVSRGLLQRLGSEAELAGALAHEISHVVMKHQLQAIQSSMKGDIGAALGREVVDQRTSRMGGGALAQQVRSGVGAVGVDFVKNGLFLRPLDRGLEYDADRMAVVLAARSGYDPFGLVGVLQMLQEAKGDGSGISILDTHPAPSDRVNELERSLGRLDRYGRQAQNEARYRQALAGK